MSGECILIIDDSAEVVKHLSERVLAGQGYRTGHAADGESGLRHILEEKPDLILLDYNLPDMTGLDVLQRMAAEAISIPVILMTGYGSELSAIEAFRLGARDYLIKPLTTDEVLEAVDRALVQLRLLHDNEKLAEQLRRAKVELSRHTQVLQAFAALSEFVAENHPLEQTLQNLLETAAEVSQAQESILWLAGGEEAFRVYRLLRQDEQPERRFSLSRQETAAGDPFAQALLETGEVQRGAAGADLELAGDANALLYVPLPEQLGLLGVVNRTERRAFGPRAELRLRVLAGLASVAVGRTAAA